MFVVPYTLEKAGGDIMIVRNKTKVTVKTMNRFIAFMRFNKTTKTTNNEDEQY